MHSSTHPSRAWLHGLMAALLFALLVWFSGQPISGLAPYYHDFKDIILHGFNASAAGAATPTFPMWGYGWLLVITENSALLLAIQFVGALGALVVLLHTAVTYDYASARAARLAWCLLLSSLPWYATHLNAYSASSVGSSLLGISTALWLRALRNRNGIYTNLIGAGAMFGLALNFRSDFYLLPLAFAALMSWLVSGTLVQRMKRTLVWLTSCYGMLLPWMLYTNATVGHPLLTSTNAGHVMFIGLGNLPGNCWGITPIDSDPTMATEIRRHFGTAKSSLVYESDKFLQKRFRELVLHGPGEYIKKCAYVAGTQVIDGFYSGVFDQEYRARIRANYPWQSTTWILLHDPWIFMKECRLVTFLALLSELQARLLLLASLLAAAILLRPAWQECNPLILVALVSVSYQLLLNVTIGYQRVYVNNQLMFLMILLAIMWDRRPRQQQRKGRNEMAPPVRIGFVEPE